jgi:hypothetical protein
LTATPPKIVGIVLVKNEEFFVTWALMNVMDFCDEIIVLDNYSSDRTFPLLSRLAEAFPKVRLQQVTNPKQTNHFLTPYGGTNTWVFGIDGDEVYDPQGLARLRKRLREGAFANFWRIYGHMFHVTGMNFASGRATGFATPPAKSTTKLHNFAAVTEWRQHGERLHGLSPFRAGFAHDTAAHLDEQQAWETTDFRALHLCFLPRSSTDTDRLASFGRPTPGESRPGRRLVTTVRNKAREVLGLSPDLNYKLRAYRRGELIERGVASFGRPTAFETLDENAPDTERRVGNVGGAS